MPDLFQPNKLEKNLAIFGGVRQSPRLANGVLAQLVERRNGIAEVKGSIPLGSIFDHPPQGEITSIGGDERSIGSKRAI